jgi:hypothetical protein
VLLDYCAGGVRDLRWENATAIEADSVALVLSVIVVAELNLKLCRCLGAFLFLGLLLLLEVALELLEVRLNVATSQGLRLVQRRVRSCQWHYMVLEAMLLLNS